MMSERLDGRLDGTEITHLEDHLTACSACRAEWHKMQTLDRLFASAQTVQSPVRVRVHVMTRLSRRDRARRAIFGGTTLTLGTVALSLIVLAPILVGLLQTTGIAPPLISGGPATLAQLQTAWGAAGRTLMVLVEKFAIPLIFASTCGLVVALVLNGLWIGTIRRLRATR
jgi:predicted anti-sigma-YlaC factor YlaD